MAMERDSYIPERETRIRQLVKGRRVLDVGCVDHRAERESHPRWLHRELVAEATEVVGLDAASDEVHALRQRGFNVVEGDATCFDLNRTFDVVVAGEILEHLLNPGEFLACARRHLTADGRLILTVPNALCVNYGIQNWLAGREKDNPDHVGLHSATTLRCLMGKAGFAVEELWHFPELGSEPHNARYWFRLAVQRLLGRIRPSLCHHILVVAKLVEQTPSGARPSGQGTA